MGEKSYLKEQVYLPGLKSQDLFSKEEFDLYIQMIELGNKLDTLEKQEDPDLELKQELTVKKKKTKALLDATILKHAGTPRTVLLESVIYKEKDEEKFPPGATWETMKFSRKISEFSSELTRAMGLKHMDYTFDQIVIEWRDIEVLQQIVMDGFFFPLMNPDGTVTNKHYHFFTSSAGQLGL